jgi:hypothetical protein
MSNASFKMNGVEVFSENAQVVTMNSGVVFPAGHVVQVKQLVDTTNREVTNTASFLSTGIELAITPSSSSNKILITVQATIGSAAGNYQYMSLLRDSTDLTPSGVNAMIQERPSGYDPTNTVRCVSYSYLDTPATISSVTYKISAKVNLGTMQIGRRNNDTGVDAPTFLTLMEISG